MNDIKKEIKETEIDCSDLQNKLEDLNRLLSSLTAFGSLELTDYRLITNHLRGAFNYTFIDDEE